MSLFWRKKVLLAKIETVYGTDPTPTGAANAVACRNIRLTPMEGEDVSRELERPFFGGQPTVAASLHAVIEFDVELQGAATAGTAPAWGPLLRACGIAETVDPGTDVVYNPITDDPESATIYINIDGTLFKLIGSRGNATLDLTAEQVPYLKFRFMGLFVQPTDTAAPTPNYTGFVKPLICNSANTSLELNSTALVTRSFMLDIGNAVEGRFLIGAEAILNTDRVGRVEATVEAVPLATFNPYTLAANQTNVEIDLLHAVTSGGGRTITFNAPTCQMQRPTGLDQQQNIVEWPLKMAPLPVAGSDDWTLTIT